jgi:hypothetical protein
MAVVPAVLLHQVHLYPAQRHRAAPGIWDLAGDVEAGRLGYDWSVNAASARQAQASATTAGSGTAPSKSASGYWC